MLSDGRKGAAQIVAAYAMAFGHCAHNRSQPGVVSVCNIGEQVVLDLVVQPAREPGDDAGAGSEIRCSSNLVPGPIILGTNTAELHGWS